MVESRLPASLGPHVRLVGEAATVGAVGGALAVGALLVVGDAAFASRKAFALGALLFGFGLLGWSGSLVAGDGFEAMQRHLDLRTGWTGRRGRRAMARIGSFGVGWMVGASFAGALLGA